MRDLKLVRSMKAKSDLWFVEYPLHIGGGSKETNGDGEIRLPRDICITTLGKSVLLIR